MRRGVRSLALALLLAGLGACAGVPIGQASRALGPLPTLLLSVDPPGPTTLLPGTLVTVRARLEGQGQFAWVSGTVRLMGAPVLGLKPAADGTWSFRTMVPPMAAVPPGHYKVRVWGRLLDGRPLSESLDYEVK